MKKMILIIAVLCCVALFGNAVAANTTATAPAATPKSTVNVVAQDSNKNLSQMNLSLYSVIQDFGSDGFRVGEAVKFPAQKAGWKLRGVQILGWSPLNETTQRFLPDETFLIEIRDKDLNLLYKYNDIQNIYFASTQGPVMTGIEIPGIPVTGDFYVVFYDRGSMVLGREMENATGNSYFFLNGGLQPAAFKTAANQTVEINWVIRALGE